MELQNVRKLDDVEHPPDIVRDTTCPLILIRPGLIICSLTRSQRYQMLTDFNPAEDTLLMAWPGRYSTDVFEVTEDDLAGLKIP